MDNALTTKDKWESVWAGVKLPTVARPVHDTQKQLHSFLPRTSGCSLIEIGCAPGAWMAYFSNHFGYSVSGLEYAEAAAEATRDNMAMLAIDADVLVQDFFTLDCEQNRHDIVFSLGFIEHFRDVSSVVQRICALSRQYVVTIVPNLYGINGFISRTIRPEVYAEHNPIDASALDLMHRHCGMETLFCDYINGVQFIAPGAHTTFFNKHKYCARAVNAPVIAFNCLSTKIGKLLCCTPRLRMLSSSLMYVGKKDLPNSNCIITAGETDFE